MKKIKDTKIVCVLDCSGSMLNTSLETMQGYNDFIEANSKLEGDCSVTLFTFSSIVNQVYTDVDIKSVVPLNKDTYVCNGMTALHDAMGKGITYLSSILSGKKKKDMPMVIFVTLTDGGENSSQSFNASKVKEMVEEQTKNGWQFVFIGANQDATLTGSSLGINADSTLSYIANAQGSQSVYASLVVNSTSLRRGVSGSMSFNDSDVKAQMAAGLKK